MRTPIIGAAVFCSLAISTFAAAQPSASPPAAPASTAPLEIKSGEWVRSADGAAIGRIEYVERAHGGAPKDVGVIYGSRIVHIPADSLSAGAKGYVTNLTKAEIGKLD